MVESVQFVTTISKLRGIYLVNIHSVRIVYILILPVTSTDSYLGFHCPTCTVYIPNTRYIDSPEEWAKCFPENYVLKIYAQSFGQRFCEACLRESEEDATQLIF